MIIKVQMSLLKLVARKNIPYMSDTLETSQADISPSKFEASSKANFMLLTLETFQLDKS